MFFYKSSPKSPNKLLLFFFFWRTPSVLHTTRPAARYIFLDFPKKKIQKGCRYIGAILDFLGFLRRYLLEVFSRSSCRNFIQSISRHNLKLESWDEKPSFPKQKKNVLFLVSSHTVFSLHKFVRSFQDDKLSLGATCEQTINKLLFSD